MKRVQVAWLAVSLLPLTGSAVLITEWTRSASRVSQAEVSYCGRPTSYWSEQVKVWYKTRCEHSCWFGREPDPLPPDYRQDENLHNLGKDLAALPVLIELLKDEHYGVRLTVLDVIAKHGPAARDAVPTLILLLKHEDCVTRYDAIRALGAIGPFANEAVPSLVEIVNDQNGLFRFEALDALFKIDASTARELNVP